VLAGCQESGEGGFGFGNEFGEGAAVNLLTPRLQDVKGGRVGGQDCTGPRYEEKRFGKYGGESEEFFRKHSIIFPRGRRARRRRPQRRPDPLF
jgi:hypothetical protein